MKKIRLNKKFIGIFAAILLIGFLVPQHQVKAVFFDFSFTNIATKMVIGLTINIVVPLITNFIEFIKTMLFQTNYFPPPVEASWSLMRNFVNMFFIIILIIMAFGTILDLDKYRWDHLLPRFLWVAVLINFSFAIGVYIIGIGNGLSNIFLSSITNILNTLGQGLSAAKIADIQAQFGGGLGIVTTGFIFLIFMFISLFALATTAFFLLVRIPFLWFLLILSPVALVGSILPNLKAQTWEAWWKQFIGWTFFLPIYMFFLMFATIFINAKNQLAPPAAGSQTQLGRVFGAYGVNDILMFAVTLIFMIGGLGIALKMSFLAGTRAGKIFGGIEGGLKRFARVSAIQKGAKQTWERIKTEGLPGRLKSLYGGEQAERQRTARYGERMQRLLGYRETFSGQKEFLNNANKEYEIIKQQYDLGRINIDDLRRGIRRFSANNPQGFAYRKMLGEIGQLDTNTTYDTINSLANNPFAAVDFIKNSSSKGKLSAVPPEHIRAMAAAEAGVDTRGNAYDYRNIVTNVAARKELYKHLQGDVRAISGLTELQFNQAMSLFGGQTTAEGSNFLKEVGKIRPDLVADYNVANPPDPAIPRTRLQYMESLLTNPKDIANIPYRAAGRDIWDADADFRTALQNTLRRGSPRRIQNFRANLEEAVSETGRDIADKLTTIAALA